MQLRLQNEMQLSKRDHADQLSQFQQKMDNILTETNFEHEQVIKQLKDRFT